MKRKCDCRDWFEAKPDLFGISASELDCPKCKKRKKELRNITKELNGY